MIRVVVADDHHLVRQGIRALLEKAGDFQVVGEAEDGLQALQLTEKLKPDVLVTDLAMPNLNGTQLTERVQALKGPTRVVILSVYSDEMMVRQALQAGAKGYLLKRSVADELLLAVRAASRGDTFLSSSIADIVMNSYLHPAPAGGETDDRLSQVSAREREIWQMIAEGQTSLQIAETLHISLKTVGKHRTSLMSKLNAHDVTALVRLAIKYGLISLDD